MFTAKVITRSFLAVAALSLAACNDTPAGPSGPEPPTSSSLGRRTPSAAPAVPTVPAAPVFGRKNP